MRWRQQWFDALCVNNLWGAGLRRSQVGGLTGTSVKLHFLGCWPLLGLQVLRTFQFVSSAAKTNNIKNIQNNISFPEERVEHFSLANNAVVYTQIRHISFQNKLTMLQPFKSNNYRKTVAEGAVRGHEFHPSVLRYDPSIWFSTSICRVDI